MPAVDSLWSCCDNKWPAGCYLCVITPGIPSAPLAALCMLLPPYIGCSNAKVSNKFAHIGVLKMFKHLTFWIFFLSVVPKRKKEGIFKFSKNINFTKLSSGRTARLWHVLWCICCVSCVLYIWLGHQCYRKIAECVCPRRRWMNIFSFFLCISNLFSRILQRIRYTHLFTKYVGYT